MTAQYHPIARGLHWLMAVMIMGLLALGFYMSDLDFSPEKLQLYSYHKWAGVTVFVLVWLRLAWRWVSPPPAMPADLHPHAQRAAHAAHWALYALMLALPLSGWLMSSAKGVPTVWFGVLPLPDLVAKDKALGHTLEEIHELLSVGILGLMTLHATAALWHHFVKRDDTLRRML